jgi:hypothetical protein
MRKTIPLNRSFIGIWHTFLSPYENHYRKSRFNPGKINKVLHMSWEKRNRSNSYYYSAKRVQGKLIKEYLGCGIAAAVLAAVLNQQKEQRKLLLQKRQEFLKSIHKIDHSIREYLRFSRRVEELHWSIEAHKEKHISTNPFPTQELLTSMNLESPKENIIGNAILKNGHVIRCCSRASEEETSQWTRMRDLAEQAQEVQVNALAADDPKLKAEILAQFQALKEELGHGKSDPLEQIVIERILITWLQLQHTDLLLAKTPTDDFRLINLLEKRACQSHNRIIRATAQLHAMRKPAAKRRRRKRCNATATENAIQIECWE